MSLTTLFPTTSLPSSEEFSGNEPRRITLLRKSPESITCLVFRGLEELRYNTPIEDALLIHSRKQSVVINYLPQVTFELVEASGTSYTRAYVKDVVKNRYDVKIIPFVRDEPFPSALTDGGLDEIINQQLDFFNEAMRDKAQDILKRGLFRSSYFPTKEFKEKRKQRGQASQTTYERLNALFREEQNDVLLDRSLLMDVDVRRSHFLPAEPGIADSLKKQLSIYGFLPLVSNVIPSNSVDYLFHRIKNAYDKRYEANLDEREKQAIALGLFAFADEELSGGLRRAFRDFKRMSDIAVYGAQFAGVSYMLRDGPTFGAVALAIPLAISGLTRSYNAYQTRGSDFSGVISSAARIQFQNQLDNDRSVRT